ncbi:Glutamate 5-kinase [Trichinella spiralis]|uniref:Glutamate 5-kinase n=1 Tax=Trichinella spiralis TaxID=6334 RepID=A0ABR3KKJ7_TRISP
MYFDIVFRQTKSGRNVRQIVVLPDPDVSEPDTVSDDELDRLSQRSHDSSEDKDDAFFNAISSLKHQHCLNLMHKYHQFLGQSTTLPANQRLFSNLEETEAEIEVLTGLLIKMGIISMSRYHMYWANQTRGRCGKLHESQWIRNTTAISSL